MCACVQRVLGRCQIFCLQMVIFIFNNKSNSVFTNVLFHMKCQYTIYVTAPNLQMVIYSSIGKSLCQSVAMLLHLYSDDSDLGMYG